MAAATVAGVADGQLPLADDSADPGLDSIVVGFTSPTGLVFYHGFPNAGDAPSAGTFVKTWNGTSVGWPGDSPKVFAMTIDSGAAPANGDTTLVTVVNVVPVVTPASDQTVAEGSTLSIDVASLTDVGLLDTHSAQIDWGDGGAPESGSIQQLAGSATVHGSHVYADNGVYQVTVRVADDDMSGDFAGGTDGVDFIEKSFDVTVTNAAPTIDEDSLSNSSSSCGLSHAGDIINVTVASLI